MARFVKALVEAVLIGTGITVYHAGLARTLIRLNGRGVRVLMYHACQEVECDFIRGLSINTRPARFAAQLEFLLRYYQVIAVEALGRGAIPERAVAITFDDGFRSVYRDAMPLLAARNIPATCYLVTDRLADRSPIWINELNWFLRRHGVAARALIARRLGISRLCPTRGLIRAVIKRYDPGVIGGLIADLRLSPGSAGSSGTPPPGPWGGRGDGPERVPLRQSHRDACRPLKAGRVRMPAGDCRRPGRPGVLARSDRLARLPVRSGRGATTRIARELGYTTLMGVEGDNDPLELSYIGRINVGSDSPAVLFARMEVVSRLKSRIKRLGRLISRRKSRGAPDGRVGLNRRPP